MSAARRVLTPERATRCATIALGHVARRYLSKPDQILDSDVDARTPRVLHPVFCGSPAPHLPGEHGLATCAVLALEA